MNANSLRSHSFQPQNYPWLLNKAKGNGIIIAILLLFQVTTSFGQEGNTLSKRNGFQLGISLNQLKEENLHPKVHVGPGFGLSYSNLRTKQNHTYFEIGAQFCRPKTRYESLAASMNIQLFTNYTYLFNGIIKNKLSYKLGPELGLHYNLSLYPNWDESHLYWADYLSFGIRNILKYHLNDKRALTLDISLPFASVISRPELERMYKIDDVSIAGVIGSMHSKLEGALWNRSFNTTSRLEYHFQITERISQSICYSFNYTRIQAEAGLPFQNLQHLIGLKLYY